MKSKNGFTLLELIAVIVILGLIGLIVWPSIEKTLKYARNDLYEGQITTIINGAKNWIADHPYDIPKNNTDSLTISLCDLKFGAYVDVKISNPATEKMFDCATKVIITNVDNTYEYNVEVGKNEDSLDADVNYPLIKMNNDHLEYLKINEEYKELGLVVDGIDMNDGYDDETYRLNIITDIVNTEGNHNLTGYTAEAGNYTVKYELTNRITGQRVILYRSIVVR